ncbi:hypothetical protein GCM10011416_19790 [Polaribacter pacificus]|uniref:Metallo-beta-lactamase domain-containing protein n=1 Tax=Polaribacter pacificus TaxID=1775173 RepID=A0A917I091_9FLAO|nr:MBL fold metallo-hydrolase [Polaribacter pacificus]GGH01147.1 hypothetical protein GCM10011416_19790 [Polaribacter pacificus]
MKKLSFLILLLFLATSCKGKEDKKSKAVTNNTAQLVISPVQHASAVISYDKLVIYIDPTGGKDAFAQFLHPTHVFITDIHGDHMDLKTLKALDLTKTTIVAPQAVVDKLPKELAADIQVMNNNDIKTFDSFNAEAIPMYNLREEALKFHSKGRGNGYVFTFGNQRVYFSGDTEDIPEMRALKNIDKAFVCMNLPYTMTIESAADAVLAFQPKEIYPYHYRGTNGKSDVAKFKTLIETANSNIKVVQLDWYPEK